MPALNGEVISTLTDSNGNVALQVVFFYDPVTRLLRDSTYTVTGGAIKTGAVIVDNQTGVAQTLVVVDPALTRGTRTINIPIGGRVATVAQLAALPTPFTTLDDMNGLTLALALA
jgi:hypothetical protein